MENDENPLDKPRKIDTLLISHRFDDEPLCITIPEIFEIHSIALSTGSSQTMKYHREFLLMLDVIKTLIENNGKNIPDMKINMAPNLPPKEIISID